TPGRKRTKRSKDRGKNVTWKHAASEERDTAFRRSNTCTSIEQKTDGFRAGNRCAPACALNKLGNRWNGNVFSIGQLIALLHHRWTLDSDCIVRVDIR